MRAAFRSTNSNERRGFDSTRTAMTMSSHVARFVACLERLWESRLTKCASPILSMEDRAWILECLETGWISISLTLPE